MPTRATNSTAANADDEIDAERGDPGGPAEPRRTRWWSPRAWRVRPRLVALVVIPTAVAVLLGGLRIAESVSNTFTHERIESMAVLGESVVELGNALGKERLLTAAYIAGSPDPANRSDTRLKELEDQRDVVDRAANEVRNGRAELGDPGSDLIAGRLQSMMSSLEELKTIRGEVTDTRITLLPTVTKYRQIITPLGAFNETIAENSEDTPLRESVRAMTALGNAREQLSFESALMLNSLMQKRMSGGVQAAVEQSRARYENEIQNFMASASASQRETFDTTYTGLEVSQMSTIRLRVKMRIGDGEAISGTTSDVNPRTYLDVSNTSLERFQKVEENTAGSVREQAAELRDNARNAALLDALLVLAVLLAVFFATSMVIRSLLRPLRTLREGAIRIAETDLPDAITRMQETSAKPDDIVVTPVKVTTKDEIAEVARSFDEVHRVALMLASDEAALRSNVNAMFVNLSRRSQTLVERQLRLIDGLEQSEQDGDRLSDLFQLDHLATRMRRNNENLLVLSGQDNTRKWAQPVPLVDVLRGAISEVEQYERVNVRAPSHISVLGRPVNDVIHLVAELVENATTFSSHDTQVSVTARQVDHGAVQVEVTDSGIGMPPDELALINQRLAEPPVIDLAVSRRMGLFVVSRLAARHGIRVRISEAHNGGITAFALFPADLLISAGDAPPALGAAPPGVPDTYAEATAAFAASPAPADPAEEWRPQAEPERSVWQSPPPEAPSSLPKRAPGHHGSQPQSAAEPEEYPPSGQDLWSTDAGWNRPALDTPAEPPQERPVRREPQSDAFRPPLDRPSVQPPPARQERQERPAPQEWQEPRRAAPEPPAREERPAQTAGHESAGWSSGWQSPPREEVTAAPPERPEAPANRHERRYPPEPEARDGYGSTAYLSKRYGASAGAGQNTVVPPSPESHSDSLPIFDSIESNWFRRRSGRPAVSAPPPPSRDDAGDETGPIPVVSGGSDASGAGRGGESAGERRPGAAPAAPQRRDDDWRSDADRGWKAARTAADPIAGGLTTSGLPKRVPKANLVPGTAPQPENFKQITSRSADTVRNRFTGFQKGIRQGRTELGDSTPEES
ncbi:hypothetical protein CLV63_11128 [Murinocardiopsis flavida]|uniref:histidine kinase n=1 Tax=Murinocardiopsis flavida TaxID=645275 RepID=A0A2P8DGS4_9ACTN|nr:hypothetical protein CLV63_11128 [Murinocardiopsis flavida]